MRLLLFSIFFLSFSLLNSQVVTIADKYPIFFTFNATVKNTSNLFNVDDEVSETVATLKPGLILDLTSSASNLNFNITADTQIKKYQKNDNLEESFSKILYSASLSTVKSSVSSSASFAQMASEGENPLDDGEVGRLLARDMTTFSVNASHQISPKFSFQTAYNFTRTDQAPGNSSLDRDSFVIPFDLYYNYSPKSAVGIGYQYTKESYDEIDDPKKSYIYLKVKGEIFPKLLADASLGSTNYDATFGSESDLGTNINLTHLYSPKARFVLALTRSFSPRATGDEVLDTSITLTSSYNFSAVISVSTSGNYRISKYTGSKDREDESRSINGSLSYKFTPKASINGSLSYRDNTSTGLNRGVDHETKEFTLSANFKF